MTRVARVSLLALLALMTACVSPMQHRKVLAANDALKKQLADLQRVNDERAQQNRKLTEENDNLKTRAADAAWIKEQKDKLKRLLGSLDQKPIPGVTAIQTAEGTALQVKGEVLFASGKDQLSTQGQGTLRQLIPHLAGNRIRISGHTDNDPVKHSKGKWRNNLELSCFRAMRVADFLIQQGLQANEVSVAGYGEFRPVTEGDSKSAKAQNRRVEILLLGR